MRKRVPERKPSKVKMAITIKTSPEKQGRPARLRGGKGYDGFAMAVVIE